MRARQIAEERLRSSACGDRPHAIETNSWEAILDAVATTDMYSLAPRHEAMRHGWASRLVAIDIPELDIKQRTGVVSRAGRVSVATGSTGDRVDRSRASPTKPNDEARRGRSGPLPALSHGA